MYTAVASSEMLKINCMSGRRWGIQQLGRQRKLPTCHQAGLASPSSGGGNRKGGRLVPDIKLPDTHRQRNHMPPSLFARTLDVVA